MSTSKCERDILLDKIIHFLVPVPTGDYSYQSVVGREVAVIRTNTVSYINALAATCLITIQFSYQPTILPTNLPTILPTNLSTNQPSYSILLVPPSSAFVATYLPTNLPSYHPTYLL